jgi:hypothetical protein
LNGLSRWGQTLSIGAKQLLQIVMRHVPETNSDWQRLLNNAMYLLEDDGHLIFELPIAQLDTSSENGPRFTSGQGVIDSFTNRFWRSGAFDYRLVYIQTIFLDGEGNVCSKLQAKGGRIAFNKRATTSLERTVARVESACFGRRHLMESIDVQN